MNRRIIIILIVVSAIIAVIAYTFLMEKTEIKKVIFSEDKSLTDAEVENYDIKTIPAFNEQSQIYAIIIASDIKKGDKLKIRWNINNPEVTGPGSKDNSLLVQEDSIEIKQEGSGKIIVSLVKKDDMNAVGDYSVDIYLRENSPLTYYFKIE